MGIKNLAFASLIIALCFSSAALGQDASVTVDGTVSYQPKMGLPANSTLHLTVVEDGTGKEVLTKDINVKHDQVPIPFTLDVPKSKITTGQSYRLEAQIKIKDRTWFKGAMKLPKDDKRNLNMVIAPAQ